jgi:serine/threonine-protein kinase RsbW
LAGDRLARGERNRKCHHWFSEGSALWVDRRVWPELLPGETSEIGGIVTAPRHSDQKGRNGIWRVLAELSVPSEPGNERLATERVAEVVKELGLSEQRLLRLKTVVAEATMNAMEHGNRYRPEVPVFIEVRSSGAQLSVRINDQGRSMVPDPDTEIPDLEAKLEGLQTPRGWGLFLIRSMVDDTHISSDEAHHTLELVMHLEGGEDVG